jgi:hypothetical protein
VDHINELERIQSQHDGGSGLAPGEQRTLRILYERLDTLTSCDRNPTATTTTFYTSRLAGLESVF